MTNQKTQMLLRLCMSGSDNPKGSYTTDLEVGKSVFKLSEEEYEDNLYSVGSIIEIQGIEYIIKNIKFMIHKSTNDYSMGIALRSSGELNPFNSTIFFDIEPK